MMISFLPIFLELMTMFGSVLKFLHPDFPGSVQAEKNKITILNSRP